MENIQTNWKDIIIENLTLEIKEILNENNKTILPPKEYIFRAFSKFNIEDTKVVIIGQDPYPTIDKNTNLPFACGYSFAIRPGQKIAPSFRNICNEIYRCYQTKRSDRPELEDLVKQGVLLLNRALTVEINKPNSHQYIWKSFTNNIIKTINEKCENVVFMLWGNNAQELEEFINKEKHSILKWSHPSPLSRKPFVGNNHFVLCNEYLEKNNKTKIDWV